MSVDEVYLTHWITLSQQIPRHSFFLTEEYEFVHALEMELKAIIPATSVIHTQIHSHKSLNISLYTINSLLIRFHHTKTTS